MSKPGQKYPTPTPGFGDRVFYESLLKQRTDSEMAQDWYVFPQAGINRIIVYSCRVFVQCYSFLLRCSFILTYIRFPSFSFIIIIDDDDYNRCLNHGILSRKKSEKLLIIVTERKRKQRTGVSGGGSSSKSTPRASSPAPPKKKKVKVKKDPTGASPVKSADI
jgi:hypothetical protein